MMKSAENKEETIKEFKSICESSPYFIKKVSPFTQVLPDYNSDSEEVFSIVYKSVLSFQKRQYFLKLKIESSNGIQIYTIEKLNGFYLRFGLSEVVNNRIGIFFDTDTIKFDAEKHTEILNDFIQLFKDLIDEYKPSVGVIKEELDKHDELFKEYYFK